MKIKVSNHTHVLHSDSPPQQNHANEIKKCIRLKQTIAYNE